jgi:hypothetical protein
MKFYGLIGFCLITAILSLAGCASTSSSSAAANPGQERKGHWETREPETGSQIARRVWVDESGRTTNRPTMGNIQTGSATDLQQIQRSRNGKPIGQ